MRRLTLGIVAAATLSLIPSCRSRDERTRESIVGTWERTADGNVSFERRFFPNGVYVERKHDPRALLPSENDTTTSGTYRVEHKRLYVDLVEGPAIAVPTLQDEGVSSLDSDELVLDADLGPTKWSRRVAPLPENLADATAKASDQARGALARASGCLLGGRIDTGTPWARLIASARGVALLPAPPDTVSARKLEAWPASCAPALEEARAALDGLLTKETIERCGPLRHVLRATLREKPTKVADYGKADGEVRRIDGIAAEAARCGVVVDLPPNAAPTDRGRLATPATPVERGQPFVSPGATSQVVRVLAASPSAESVRFVVGSKAANDGSAFEGLLCATRGSAAATSVRCEPLKTRAEGIIRPLTSLAEDAPLWATQGVGALVRPGQPEIPLRTDFALDGRAYIDATATVLGTSVDGVELRVTSDGRATESPGAKPPGRITPRGDLRFASTAEGFSVSRAGDVDPATLGRTRQTKSYRDIEPCYDGNRFGFVARDETSIVAGVPRLDGSLAIVDVEVAADGDRSDQAPTITCEPETIRITWLSRETRVVRVDCRPSGCKLERSDPLPDRAPGTVAVTALGDRVLLAKLGAIPAAELGLRGQVVYRVADLPQLAAATDRVLLAEPDIDTPDGADPERLSLVVSTFATRSAALVAVTSTAGLYLFRIEPDGSAKAISP